MNRLCVILLAAGRSSRFGSQDKLMAPLGASLVIDRALSLLNRIAAQQKFVVTSPTGNQVRRRASSYGLHCLVAKKAELGLGASLAHAVSKSSRRTDAFMILLADMPYMHIDHVENVFAFWMSLRDQRAIARPYVADCFGKPQPSHPVIFGAAHRQEMMRFVEDKDPIRYLHRCENDLHRHKPSKDMPAYLFEDIDVRSDLTKWVGGNGGAFS